MGLSIFLVVILFLLAITDLIVGVSNDAVNFLNSAVGSRVAKFRTIIIVAAAGVILGSIFSSGIMEIARKGIFYPQFFTLDKIIWIFLAVMLTDIVLLDVFNSLGLPTSTTVSIVFELLGASLIAGLLFSIEKQEPINDAMKYINAGSVVSIISGIFLSIIIAFTAGIVIQYGCRLLFTFEIESKIDRYGALFAGLGITSIIYFLLIKGLEGTTILSGEQAYWIREHIWLILLILFLAGTLISFLLQRILSINPLKLVVLMGTFSLAMAFAGNDLVNFIGVPITGFLAFQNWKSSGVPANEFYQDYLASNDVIVPNYMLIIAGIIMALTLWLSSKAKKVTQTEVSLGSQNEADERFQPNLVARSIVKTSINFGRLLSVFIPKFVAEYYDFNFQKSKIRQAVVIHDRPAFDLVRASANLMIASILIAWATSMKLPLSTTYVSFMVAMGTSLADRAWGRESAVYRVAGVLSVIGGWFVTAIIAFGLSALFAFILIKGQITGSIILFVLVGVYIVSSQIRFNKNEKKIKADKKRFIELDAGDIDIFEANKKRVIDTLSEIQRLYKDVLIALKDYDSKMLDNAFRSFKKLEEDGFKLRAQSIRYIKNLQNPDKRTSEILLYSTDLLQDITSSAINMTEECLHYVLNLHHLPDKGFIKTSEELRHKMDSFISKVIHALHKNNFKDMDSMKIVRDDAREFINEKLSNRLAVIQKEKPGTKQAILETNILLQSRDMLAVTLRILKMYRKYFG